MEKDSRKNPKPPEKGGQQITPRTRKVEVRYAAEEDLAEIGIYLLDSSPQTTERFLAAVSETIKALAMEPGIGSLWGGRREKTKEIRFITVTGFDKYLLFYRFDASTLYVLRVLHGSRHLKRLLRGL